MDLLAIQLRTLLILTGTERIERGYAGPRGAPGVGIQKAWLGVSPRMEDCQDSRYDARGRTGKVRPYKKRSRTK
jgi:hypothetical protein